jgi:hypothetical protein
MATASHVDRSTIYRHLRQSVAEGLISADALPRQSRREERPAARARMAFS